MNSPLQRGVTKQDMKAMVMRDSPSIRYAKQMIALEAIVFFEVWVDDSEDPLEVAQEISAMGASTVVDSNRRIIKVFSADPMPKGFGFL